jgi:hypothetical protein
LAVYTKQYSQLRRVNKTDVGSAGEATNMRPVLFGWLVGGGVNGIIREKTVKLLLWLIPVRH